MLRFACLLIAAMVCLAPAHAQEGGLNALLETHRAKIEKPSRTTISPVLEDLVDSQLPSVAVFLENWREKGVWQRRSDGRFFFVKPADGDEVMLIDVDTGADAGLADRSELSNLNPNSGVRAVIAAALVQFQLSDPDPARRLQALTALARDANQSHLSILREAIEAETDPDIKARKERLERLLTIRFGSDSANRVAAIESFAGDPGVDARAALNPLVATSIKVFDATPEGVNVARLLTPGSDIEPEVAYQLLVDAGKARPIVPLSERKRALIANIQDGAVADIPVADLVTQEARDRAYLALAAAGAVPPLVSREEQRSAVAAHVFAEIYSEPDPALTTAARQTLSDISGTVGFYRFISLALDGLSLASIYFLAAIGLAITFGVMGVINMAHGEFIMIGAYTGYVVQQFIPNYTASILVALPLAFAVAFMAGVALERLVIRHLAHRPLETLLATFGISIALQQIAKNIFGTQARPLTSPSWLDGAWALNDVVSVSYIRIAIFVLAVVFMGLLLFILKRTRLGLEIRAVTQNPRMASSMGINPDRINMMTFGLGSGIAGIAGVAIGLFAKVTSELGSGYIVQSFMTVVVGGVGNIWGTLAGAGMIGSLQKVIEFFNPSNTLAAQTYMIIFIIIFIQFRPKGIIALKGRAAGD
ncbi:MAG: urea ABC transporter permease subunit UrtB [Hoeflea sp.]|uniref:urea ABC transporter permease subunit UrtB n=1 Tax=Hoeflea sp. TaxID=1940281 RepID=UPI001DF850F7|nr:urea ABC transporter permease subunit UrtB [Hoeflea sp.]MBU4528813.1 urea ABC transporter permease subunit UrtB [Alphaproteobacteria bacterium]MBU4545860.1 urea ABC transporter permease subunit UrtB [Alphaproteobacteria bacterium]MBU4549947.1 urea ABC transporter permease subunit UrtB [Alphaproteobacteria bacterium]MBV1725944.1 urea ABC transporter permease subunit UrtB [Hoeflea sp.]MBV1762669.1 urea ABC transporter permease subunit UrtB [Hoeflea sp.]